MWHLNNSSQKLNLKYESPASHPWVTRLLRSGAIESPASRWKVRVPREAKLSRDDRSLLYHGLAISNTSSHAKNRNDLIPITWSKVALHEDAFFGVAILGGGWLQSPASDGPPCIISCNKYDTEPLFKCLSLLKVEDNFKIKALKFHHKYSQTHYHFISVKCSPKFLIVTIMEIHSTQFKFFINIQIEPIWDGNA